MLLQLLEAISDVMYKTGDLKLMV